jgi:ribosomal protein L40E
MTSSAISTEGEPAREGAEAKPAPRRRRRVPLLVWGAAGALVAGLYAALIEHMRFGPPLVMLALGGMTLAFAAAALWRVIDPLTRNDSGTAAVERARRPRRVRELEREKQLVLKAIKEVELDYQMRKVAERDYRDMVERYRTRALRLMTELEAGDDYRALIERELALRLKIPVPAPVKETAKDTAAAAPADPALCVSCGTRNDDDAQFCKKCGSKLGS